MDLDPHRQHALGLDPDVQVGRLAGDREVAAQPALDRNLGRPLVELLGLLVGDADQPHPHPILALGVLERAHHPGQAALHVVGAAADQPVVFNAGLELLGAPGDDVEMAVKHHAGGLLAGGTDLRHQYGQPVVIVIWTSMSRDSSQPFTNPAAATRSSAREVS